MLLYRIAKADYIQDLGVTGGLYGSGRWHRKGTRILYTSLSEPLARLEVLANYNIIPPGMQLLTLEVPDDLLPFKQVKVEDLPADWRRFYPYPPGLAEMALEWIQSNESLGLLVPSIHSAVERNLLINPLHSSHSHLRIVSVQDVQFDPRLKGI